VAVLAESVQRLDAGSALGVARQEAAAIVTLGEPAEDEVGRASIALDASRAGCRIAGCICTRTAFFEATGRG
jgi:hypothetical protein